MDIGCHKASGSRRHVRRDSALRCVQWVISFCLPLLAVANAALAEISSDDHPTLKRALEQHPDADVDRDGHLSYAEYRALLERHPPRQESGRPAGPISTVLASGDLIISEFEENNPAIRKQWGWTLSGVFDRDLNVGTQQMKRRAGLLRGAYLVTSYIESDGDVGEVLSPPFEIEQSHIELVISGGDHPGRACVNLIVDGQTVRTATGQNDDYFATVAFDVAPLKGKVAQIQIVDAHRGIWGHINVDRIYQTNNPRAKRVIADAPAHVGILVGSILTRDGRQIHGPVAINEGQFTVGNQVVDPDSILVGTFEQVAGPLDEEGAVALTNGEVWKAKVVGFAKDKVTIDSALFGQREVSAADVASLNFTSAAPDGGPPGMLYRNNGDPIPGKLIWVRDKDIAIDCALGIVPLPREIVQRFTLAPVDLKAPRGPAEVGLVNGSVFRGGLLLQGDAFSISHSVLGDLTFTPEQVRYIQRTPDDVTWFDRLTPSELNQIGPILPPPPPQVVESGELQGATHLRSVRILPQTTVSYALQQKESTGSFFRGRLAPVPGCRAKVVAKILADRRVVWEQRIAPGAEAIDVTADLGSATTMTVEVGFGEQVAFPCGVDWFDAYVVSNEN